MIFLAPVGKQPKSSFDFERSRRRCPQLLILELIAPRWPERRLLLFRFSDAGMTRLSTRCGGRRPKSAKARSRAKYGTRQCSECYGDRMLVAISMVDAAPARGDVEARMHVSPGESNEHLGGHTEFINGRLVN